MNDPSASADSYRVDIDGAVKVAGLAATFDWTWQVDDLPRFSAAAGWEVTEIRHAGASLATNLDVDTPDADVSFHGYQVASIDCYVSDLREADEVSSEELTSRYNELANRLPLGTSPTPRPPQPEPSIGWDLERVIIFVVIGGGTIYLSLVNPRYQAWIDAPEDDDEDE